MLIRTGRIWKDLVLYTQYFLYLRHVIILCLYEYVEGGEKYLLGWVTEI